MSDSKSIVKKRLVGAMARVARSVTQETNSFGWPPVCMGILYQPKRFIKAKNDQPNKAQL